MRRAKAKRTFTKGQRVSVQREVGKMWEPATYEHPSAGMKGWHSVKLDRPWFINERGDEATDADRARPPAAGQFVMATNYKVVPTQRIKEL